ncbi:hypothetical protein ACFORO_08380 [Amycolatopsis halotolerans]|uniref:Secreted protein n=1 Tax=Amycolatopsis halotolerans TaxID=330083 RepID=A0ABV7QDT2_9PSEU
MTQLRYPTVGLMVVSIVLAGCSNAAPPPPSAPSSAAAPSSPWIPTPEHEIAPKALAVYRQYWELSEQAEAAPRSQDWRPALTRLMADPALTSFVDELANLASVPAHSAGQYRRAPSVRSVSVAEPARVVIDDCLDASEEHLVSDRVGEAGKYLDNPQQPRRYRLEAEVVRYPAPYRWLVQIVRPHVDQPC